MKLLLTTLLCFLASTFVASIGENEALKWCVTSTAESVKCNNLRGDDRHFTCELRTSVLHCIEAIKRNETDFLAVDGGEVYTAGKCGLVPVMAEQYNKNLCGTSGDTAFSYYAVAVVKKNSGVTWQNLRGKKSCHTGVGRTAGWNIPMSHIYNQTKDCNFTKFFSSGCAPGSNITSPFCAQCDGAGEAKCKANNDEPYFGYAGAFKCLIEGAGDVAFVKHTTVPENTDGNGPNCYWSLPSTDFELICPGNRSSVPITEYASCNLARVPPHAVISREDSRTKVVNLLQELQHRFGPDSGNSSVKIFESNGGRNLLFKDSTKCLQEVRANTFESFLGNEYIRAVSTLRRCTANTPGLEACCTTHNCQTTPSMQCDHCSA